MNTATTTNTAEAARIAARELEARKAGWTEEAPDYAAALAAPPAE